MCACLFSVYVRSVYVSLLSHPTARGPDGYNPADEFECQVCVCACVCACVCVCVCVCGITGCVLVRVLCALTHTLRQLI